MPDAPANEPANDYDVVVIGGALSGSSTAILLLRRNPGIRILIVEKTETLGRRVGEATVEVSGHFLGRVLGLTRYLNEHHISKQGLRFWFANEQAKSLDQAAEIGPRYLARLPSYQIDRAELDEEVLRRADAAGAKVLRPATILRVELDPGGMQKVEVKHDGTNHTISARWVIDASGLSAVLARKNGWWQPNTAHPTAAAWCRWRNVKDWDGRELAEKFPAWAAAQHGTRGTATNHLVGDGWWSWWIPLKGGDTSIGIVWDQRLVDFPRDGRGIGERMRGFLTQHPVGAELLEHAEFIQDDMHWRKNLAYRSSTFAGDGFALVGDAAAFMEPFYSPGMDWIAFTASRAADLITRQRSGEEMQSLAARHNQDFSICHDRWFAALYLDKYDYIGEFDLLDLAFRLDLGLYYWGVVEPIYNTGESAYLAPPFTPPSGRFFAALMRTYNRRFAAIARLRRREGRLGRMNANRRKLIAGFTLDRADTRRIFPMLGSWLLLEIREGWRSWGERKTAP
jgi:flavin-dependent dehydrogenase